MVALNVAKGIYGAQRMGTIFNPASLVFLLETKAVQYTLTAHKTLV